MEKVLKADGKKSNGTSKKTYILRPFTKPGRTEYQKVQEASKEYLK